MARARAQKRLPYPKGDWVELENFVRELSQFNAKIKAGVVSTGEAASYALVWEWGNIKQVEKGPRTVMGINPDGKRVWMSSQAPRGYISILKKRFDRIVEEELAKIDYGKHNKKTIKSALQLAGIRITKRWVALLKKTAPEDTGQLIKSFRAVRLRD